ncbi:uncharacterized protein LOC120540096 [Polypterus senegalus]|uniref:uncharacterized protein LOC120540096 n=1 Tax=Polypterus senegalus TaxID=55291 RepID=UPI001962BE51|nr:uncharacterized protein LOC120540096 [Polypterus senegalus]
MLPRRGRFFVCFTPPGLLLMALWGADNMPASSSAPDQGSCLPIHCTCNFSAAAAPQFVTVVWHQYADKLQSTLEPADQPVMDAEDIRVNCGLLVDNCNGTCGATLCFRTHPHPHPASDVTVTLLRSNATSLAGENVSVSCYSRASLPATTHLNGNRMVGLTLLSKDLTILDVERVPETRQTNLTATVLILVAIAVISIPVIYKVYKKMSARTPIVPKIRIDTAETMKKESMYVNTKKLCDDDTEKSAEPLYKNLQETPQMKTMKKLEKMNRQRQADKHLYENVALT